jgi:hypothetical protein
VPISQPSFIVPKKIQLKNSFQVGLYCKHFHVTNGSDWMLHMMKKLQGPLLSFMIFQLSRQHDSFNTILVAGHQREPPASHVPLSAIFHSLDERNKSLLIQFIFSIEN